MQHDQRHPSTYDSSGPVPALDGGVEAGASDSTILRELLLLEDSALDAIRELRAYRRLQPGIQEQGVVVAALLKHPDDSVRESAFNFLIDQYETAPEMHCLLYIAASAETNSALSTSMHQQLSFRNSGRSAQLSSLLGELRFNTRYAKEQNMKTFGREMNIPERTFDRILISSLDADPAVRNASADALQQALPLLSTEQRQTALWHVAFCLREHNSDQSRSSFQGRILSSASFFRDNQALLLPLVLKLCESSDLLLRVDAACTTLFLSREKEDLVTDIVANSLRNRFQLRDAPPLSVDQNSEKVKRTAEVADAEIEIEYQWHRFGIAEFLRLHHGIDIEMSEEMHQVHIELDSIRARFSDRLNEIVARFEEEMALQAQRTSDLLSKYFRTSLVGMAGAPLPLLSEANQRKILHHLFEIIIDGNEAPMVKIRALELIPRATISHDESVGPLLQAALLRSHSEYPELRIQAYKTINELNNLSAASRKIAMLGISELGLYDPDQKVALIARETLATLRGEISSKMDDQYADF